MKKIAITPGDLTGIGPEVIVKALKNFQDEHLPDAKLIIIGNSKIIFETAKKLSFDLKIKIIDAPHQVNPWDSFYIIPAGKEEISRGVSSAQNAVNYIDMAVDYVMKGVVDAIVTGPVSKKLINEAGINFRGHTEYIAAIAKCKNFAMMFVWENVKVVLASTHIPLRRITSVLDCQRIVKTIELASKALRDKFNILNPRIGVCGINPHAGEQGILGKEEQNIIMPAIQICQKNGINCSGPFSADRIFRRMINGEFDAIVGMYHDQVLPVIKTLTESAVNLTIGLPFIRTSPDHGVAFDIAGKGIANPDSMKNAITLAINLARTKGTLF
jgi:4-hydroxythreonine-4-phosphate dehydrogenase